MQTKRSAGKAGESFTIGRLAAAAGAHVETVLQRTYRAIQRCGAEDLRRLRFIKRA